MSNFLAFYARFFSRAAKVMAASWILAGVAMAAISPTMKQNSWLIATCAGLFVVGVAIFFAKPVTGEKLQRIARGERLWGP
jgi:hypothetical protein